MSTDKKQIRIGLLGFGGMGKTHAYAVNNLKFFYPNIPFDACVAGVCTTTMEKSRAVADTFGFAKATTNEDELIGDPDIDVIDICTPNLYHAQTIKKAVAQGKHIYCEKPLCVSLAEAKEILDVSAGSDKIHKIVFNNRYFPAVLRAKQLVDEGRLGRILSFHATYLHSSGLTTSKKAGWKQDKTICGGGVLFDLGSHVIDLVYHLCGNFDSVSVATQIGFPERTGRDGQPWKTNADEAFYMIAKLDCGAVGTITAGKIHAGATDDLCLEVYGDKGSIRYSLNDPNWLYFFDNANPEVSLGGMRGYTRIETLARYPQPGGLFPAPKAPVGWLQGQAHSMYDFLNSVYTGIPSHPDFLDAARVQAIMEAGYASAASGRFEKVEKV